MSKSSPTAVRAAANRSTISWTTAGVGDRLERAGAVHLQRGESGRLALGGEFGHARRVVAADAAVDPHPLADRTAEQLVHGHAAHLAGNVPERLVDPGDGAREHRAAAVEAALGQHLPVVLDRQRILADQQRSEFLDSGTHGGRLALDHRLAPADDALVGLDPQEQPARWHQEGLDPVDLHTAPVGSARCARQRDCRQRDCSGRPYSGRTRGWTRRPAADRYRPPPSRAEEPVDTVVSGC